MNSTAPAFFLAALVPLASTCQQVAPRTEPYHQPSAASSAYLLGTWDLLSVDGIAMPLKKVSVTFEKDGRFTAMVDCNTARGFYTFNGTVLSFNGWESTERGCVPPLAQEALVGEALRGDAYRVAPASSSELHLSGKHNPVFRRP